MAAVTLDAFMSALDTVADGVTSYRTGGTGKDSTCDCIGLIMGAMYALGHGKYSLHSSNYFARYQTDNMTPISAAAHVYRGMIVYKARSDQSKLADRYKAGGAHHAGDDLDYYHVGVVLSASPLRIMHCTSSPENGINIDEKIGKWNRGGMLKGITYEKGEKPMEKKKGVVIADSGSTVNLREGAGTKNRLIAKVPVGTELDIIEDAGEWMKVTAAGKTGYMMSNFVNYAGAPDETKDQDDEVTLTEVQRNDLKEAVMRIDSMQVELEWIREIIEGMLGGDQDD